MRYAIFGMYSDPDEPPAPALQPVFLGYARSREGARKGAEFAVRFGVPDKPRTPFVAVFTDPVRGVGRCVYVIEVISDSSGSD